MSNQIQPKASDPKLSRVQEAYVKKMEREKVAREVLLVRMKRRNRAFLYGGLAAVFGICKFTCFVSSFEHLNDDAWYHSW